MEPASYLGLTLLWFYELVTDVKLFALRPNDSEHLLDIDAGIVIKVLAPDLAVSSVGKISGKNILVLLSNLLMDSNRVGTRHHFRSEDQAVFGWTNYMITIA